MKTLQNQTENRVTISGKLVNRTLREGTTKTGKPYIGGRATIRVNQSYLGIDETCHIPVSFFATKYTSKGSNNPSYENIMALSKYKTIEDFGEAEADTVRLTGASIRENSYTSKAGNVVDGWQIDASFINHGVGDDCATFNLNSMVVLKKTPEIDRISGDETGRLIIQGAIVQYGGRLDVLDFVIDDPNMAAQFDNNCEENSTIKAWGRVRSTVKEDKKPVESSSWGEDEPTDSTTRTVRELVLTGSKTYDDEELEYDLSEIKKGFNQRKAAREQSQSDAKSSTSTASKKRQMSWE